MVKSQNLYFSWWNLHIVLLRGQQQVIFTVRYWAILPSVAVPCSRHAFQGPSPRWNLPESSRGCKWRVEKNTMHLVCEPSRQLQGRRGDSVRASLQRRLALGLLSWPDSLGRFLKRMTSWAKLIKKSDVCSTESFFVGCLHNYFAHSLNKMLTCQGVLSWAAQRNQCKPIEKKCSIII